MEDEKTDLQILHTKLHQPQIHRDHIPRLLQLLNNSKLRPLTLVTPPPRIRQVYSEQAKGSSPNHESGRSGKRPVRVDGDCEQSL